MLCLLISSRKSATKASLDYFLFQYINLTKTLGRKRQLIVAALLYLLGGAITASAPELGVLLAGRLLYGLGIGLVGYFKQ